MPGATDRARLVRKLQRRPNLRLAVYGQGWTGRGTRGVLTFEHQVGAIRKGLLTANWDHYPNHARYASDRLAISMLAGRPHVTTHHERLDWVPTNKGVFLEPSVTRLVGRVESLLAREPEDLLAHGMAAHQWARRRISHREAARFMLGAADPELLAALPAEPWVRLIDEWPRGGVATPSSH